MSRHQHRLRVYYEDTDAGGVVYHANYLKFCERARTEWLRALGFGQARMAAETGAVFVVSAIEARFRRPARLDDALVVFTAVSAFTPARIVMAQEIARDAETLFTARVEVVLVSSSTGRPMRPPAALRRALDARVIISA